MKSIFVGDLDLGATEESIRKLFSKYGEVGEIRVEVDRDTGKLRGFAFVKVRSDADAERATALSKAASKSMQLKGPAMLSISETTPRVPRSKRQPSSKSPASTEAARPAIGHETQSGHLEVNVAGTEGFTVDLDGIVSVTGRAIEVFGAREKAIQWLRTPLPSLSNKTPLSLLQTAAGIEQIEDVLGRIEQGVW